MGMFDKPKYLTGDDGWASPGQTFWLHNARLDGTTNVNGTPRDQAKLLVSESLDSPRETVYTSGAGIVNQIRRMSREDVAAFPIEVRLDQIPSQKGNPTNVLTPASEPEPDQTALATGDNTF